MNRDTERPRTHPGAILREDVLPATRLTKVAFARALGVSRQTLYDLIGEKQPVTPAMAVRLGKLCGNGPEFWLRLQIAYDLWRAKQDVDTAEIITLSVAS
ncbi:MAG: HigA family addiction module antitoxin [Robiginitomaculum sp.]|nr:HigA family addiction module antitoxin [Robiginitomaculum sp.]